MAFLLLGVKFPAFTVDAAAWIDDTDLDYMVVRPAVVPTVTPPLTAALLGTRIGNHWKSVWDEFTTYDAWLKTEIATVDDAGVAAQLVALQTQKRDALDAKVMFGGKNGQTPNQESLADGLAKKRISARNNAIAKTTLDAYKEFNRQIERLLVARDAQFDTRRSAFLLKQQRAAFKQHHDESRDVLAEKRPHFKSIRSALRKTKAVDTQRNLMRMAYRFEPVYRALETAAPLDAQQAQTWLDALLAELEKGPVGRNGDTITALTQQLDQFAVTHAPPAPDVTGKTQEPTARKKQKRFHPEESSTTTTTTTTPPPTPSPPDLDVQPFLYDPQLPLRLYYTGYAAYGTDVFLDPFGQSPFVYPSRDYLCAALPHIGNGVEIVDKIVPVREKVLEAAMTRDFEPGEIITFWDGVVRQLPSNVPLVDLRAHLVEPATGRYVDGTETVYRGGASYAQPNINKAAVVAWTDFAKVLEDYNQSGLSMLDSPFNTVSFNCQLKLTGTMQDPVIVAVASTYIAPGTEIIYKETDAVRVWAYWLTHRQQPQFVPDVTVEDLFFAEQDDTAFAQRQREITGRIKLLGDAIARLNKAEPSQANRVAILQFMLDQYQAELFVQ